MATRTAVLIKLPPEVIAQHRLNAWLGLMIWLISTALLLVLAVLRPDHLNSPLHFMKEVALPVAIADGVVSFASFFWGTYSLAVMKGYPGAAALFGIMGPPAQLVVIGGLLLMENRQAAIGAQMPMKNANPPLTNNQRIAICRRKAAISIPMGLVIVAGALALVWYRTHLFASQDTQRALAMGVFAAGHGLVMAGCWWWLRAKHWTDFILVLGVLPFGALALPAVRAGLETKGILVTVMAMLPLIVLAVTVVLPDNAPGIARGK